MKARLAGAKAPRVWWHEVDELFLQQSCRVALLPSEVALGFLALSYCWPWFRGLGFSDTAQNMRAFSPGFELLAWSAWFSFHVSQEGVHSLLQHVAVSRTFF